MRKTIHRALAVITALLMFISGLPMANAAWGQVADSQGHWAEAQLRAAYERGLIEVNLANELRPDEPITMAEALDMLCRLVGAKNVSDTAGLELDEDAWYLEIAGQALRMGLIDPVPQRFDAPLTRAGGYLILSRFYGLTYASPDYTQLVEYPETGSLTIQERGAFVSFVTRGLIDPKRNGPRGQMSRAEYIELIYRAGGMLYSASASNITVGSDSINELVIVRSDQLKSLNIEPGAYIERLVLAAFGDDVTLDTNGSHIETLSLSGGGGHVTTVGEIRNVEITGDHRELTLRGYTPNVTISGDVATLTVPSGVTVRKLTVNGADAAITVNGYIEELTVSGTGCEVLGGGRIDTLNVFAPGYSGSISAGSVNENVDVGLGDVSVTVTAQERLAIGEPLLATAVIATQKPTGATVTGEWYIDGVKVYETPIVLGVNRSVQLSYEYSYNRNLAASSEIAFALNYETVGGSQQAALGKTVVGLDNYDAEYYYMHDTERVLSMVSSVYKGDYTPQWAVEHDYEDYEKELWVNAKWYSSSSDYLLWVNLENQRINIFEGSQGNWTLLRSGIVGTGRPGSATPVGVWKTTYKQELGWTTGSYTVKPVVRFLGGGYAFHSRLYYPGTTTLQDASIGFPVSAGCVRMMDEDIQFLFDHVPDGTTVVVY